jgi:D-cysteine desulfhydrase family pyridoxal phosphate-dependent enzyme
VNIAEIPRVRLAQLPTPLVEAEALTRAIGGPRILIKREDQTGLAFGGNKARKLEFLLADAVAEGADSIVVSGAFQSNMARMTAAAARKLGLHPVLVLGGLPEESQLPQGNLLLDDLLDATVHLCVREDRWDVDDAVAEVQASLRQQGRRPYVIPMGGSTAHGTVSYTAAAIELYAQLCDLGITADYVLLPTGTGSTQAGLEIGARLLASPFQVMGLSVSRSRPVATEKVCHLMELTANLLGARIDVRPDEILIRDDYIGPGYGAPTDAGREAIRLTARAEGLFLDPVYTGKAMAGLIDLVERGELTSTQTVVFLHTGGTPALFAYADYLAQPREGPR